jgi:hypothetical protein
VRSILAARCARREHRPDTVAWAQALVRDPERYGADEHARQIVARLLAEVTR